MTFSSQTDNKIGRKAATGTQINTYISTQKLTKPLPEHIKTQLQGLSCCSEASGPAHRVLPFVGIKER